MVIGSGCETEMTFLAPSSDVQTLEGTQAAIGCNIETQGRTGLLNHVTTDSHQWNNLRIPEKISASFTG